MCAIKIGWAKRDISTLEPVNINGQMYLRISEGIHDLPWCWMAVKARMLPSLFPVI